MKKIVGHPHLRRDDQGFVHYVGNYSQLDREKIKKKRRENEKLSLQVQKLTEIIEELKEKIA